ncbi:unnamed protein product [Didymodactylos carnosus]|uniref:FH2 domain-containing protein n=1 Tax=Didymodactylos carnosus TaxID=1234261 RepID=A0A8S2IE23_9BILA|nr:unnamed protein product [Didymodactylos carnosus]CAF3740525.1 unnamed protein product [Didymodactylos carnosus]
MVPYIETNTPDNDSPSQVVPSLCDIGSVPHAPPPPPPPPPFFHPMLANLHSTELPHQHVSPVLVEGQHIVHRIQARVLPTCLFSTSNIWTKKADVNIKFNPSFIENYFVDNKTSVTQKLVTDRRTNIVSIGGGGELRSEDVSQGLLLDRSVLLMYDVSLKYILKTTSIDHIISSVDNGKSIECLDRIRQIYKHFTRNPKDVEKFSTYAGSFDALKRTEQFLMRFICIRHYNFKFQCLCLNEDLQSQLDMSMIRIHNLLEAINQIRHSSKLPGMLHLLCLLFNSVSRKNACGLDFSSIINALQSKTTKPTITVANVLCMQYDEIKSDYLQLPDELQPLLKNVETVKYKQIYQDIHSLYQRFAKLKQDMKQIDDTSTVSSAFISMFQQYGQKFEILFAKEDNIKQGEKALAVYFCDKNLTLETCLSTISQFCDKIRQAHQQNLQRKRFEQEQKRLISLRLKTDLFDSRTPTSPMKKYHSASTNKKNLLSESVFANECFTSITTLKTTAQKRKFDFSRSANNSWDSDKSVKLL